MTMMRGMDSGKGKANVFGYACCVIGLYEFLVSLLKMFSCHGLEGIDR